MIVVGFFIIVLELLLLFFFTENKFYLQDNAFGRRIRKEAFKGSTQNRVKDNDHCPTPEWTIKPPNTNFKSKDIVLRAGSYIRL